MAISNISKAFKPVFIYIMIISKILYLCERIISYSHYILLKNIFYLGIIKLEIPRKKNGRYFEKLEKIFQFSDY
jgi:hypothetical protein